MARPNKNGLDYFPLDVDIFSDNKLKFIRARFDEKGELIAIKILCGIYRNGYYTEWNEDISLIFSDSAGKNITANLANDVVHELVKRGFFDKGIFDRFKLLTSKGIQRRYITAVKDRKDVEIISDYWLIDLPEDTKNTTFFITRAASEVSSAGNEVNSVGNDTNKTKVNKSKSKESNPPKSPDGGHGKKSAGNDTLNEIFKNGTKEYSPALKKTALEWIKYKKQIEKKSEPYVPDGLKKWLKKCKESADLYGEATVIEVIDDTMSNNYKGVTWNILKKINGGSQNGSNGGNTGKSAGESRKSFTELAEEIEKEMGRSSII